MALCTYAVWNEACAFSWLGAPWREAYLFHLKFPAVPRVPLSLAYRRHVFMFARVGKGGHSQIWSGERLSVSDFVAGAVYGCPLKQDQDTSLLTRPVVFLGGPNLVASLAGRACAYILKRRLLRFQFIGGCGCCVARNVSRSRVAEVVGCTTVMGCTRRTFLPALRDMQA
jgi:hypothetical protein